MKGCVLPPKLDEIDSELIGLLKKNGRLRNTEIAKALNISESTVRKRLRKLLDGEWIKIVAVGNLAKIVNGVVGNVKLKVDKNKVDQVAAELAKLDGLWYIALLAGASDFDLEFSVKTQEELHALLSQINKIEGVREVETSFRLQLIKNRYDWELPDVAAEFK